MGVGSKDDHDYSSANNQTQNSPHSPSGTSKGMSKWEQRGAVVSVRHISGVPAGAVNLFNDKQHLDNDGADGDGEGVPYNASSSDVELNMNYHNHISGCSRSSGSRSDDDSGGQSAEHRGEQEEQEDPQDDTIVDIIIDCEDSVVQVHPNPNTDRKHTPPILGLGICNPHIHDCSSNSKTVTSSLSASVLPRGLFSAQNPFRRLLSRDRSVRHSHSRPVLGRQQQEEGGMERLSGRIVIHRTVTYGVSESVQVEEDLRGVPAGGKGTMGCVAAGEGGTGALSASSVVIGTGVGDGGSGSGVSELQG